MAVSLYDQPAQAQFINTYVPIDFNSIVQAGLARQGRYDTNIARQEQFINELEAMRAMPGADTEYLNRATSTVRDLAERYATRDYSNNEVMRELFREIRSSGINNRNLADIASSYAGYQNYMKQVGDLKLKNLWSPELAEDFSKWDTIGSGLVFSGSPEAVMDYRPKEETYFNNLRGNRYVDQKTGEIREYIDDSQITRLAQVGAADYAKSQEGNQRIRRFRNRTGVGQDQISDEQLAYQFLVKTGQEKKYNESVGLDPRAGQKAEQPLYRINSLTEKLSPSIERSSTVTDYDKATKALERNGADEASLKIISNVLSRAQSSVETSYGPEYNQTMQRFTDEAASKVTAVVGDPQLTDLILNTEGAYTAQKVKNDKGETVIRPPITTIQNIASENGVSLNTRQISQIRDALGELKYQRKREEKKYEDRVKQEYESLVKRSDQYSELVAPAVFRTNEVGQMTNEEGKKFNSEIYRYLETIVSKPESGKIRPIGGTDDSKLKNLKEAFNNKNSEFKIDEISNPSDVEGNYVNFTVYDSEGNKTGNYRVDFNTPSERQVILKDLVNGGYAGEALRQVEQSLYQDLVAGIKAQGDFDLTIDGEKVNVSLLTTPSNREAWGIEIDGFNYGIYNSTEELFTAMLLLKGHLK